jgi:lysozyme
MWFELRVKIAKNGLDLLKNWEKGHNNRFADVSYKCPGGKNTIGWGHVILATDNIKQPICETQATELLLKDIKIAEDAVNKKVNMILTQNQFDALVCFVFNVGASNFIKSTLLKVLNDGLLDKVPTQFMRWVYANKVFVKGLENRRKAEVNLWNYKNE